MSIEIKVPPLPESINDATVAAWHKNPGDYCEEGESIADLETDKVMLEVPASASGVLAKINRAVGSVVTANEVIGMLEVGSDVKNKPVPTPEKTDNKVISEATIPSAPISPAVRQLIQENNVDVSKLIGTGKSGRISKEDVQSYLVGKTQKDQDVVDSAVVVGTSERIEKRVPMTRLRARIAERLVQAQQTAAILTSFNEVNMQPIMQLRQQYRESFEKKHKVKLGFMSFFVKAVAHALKQFPEVNASIDGSDVIYHGYYDMGIAISSPRGLVVPIIRDVDKLTMAEIEQSIIDYGQKAKDGKLSMEDMTGGTFTISNGGVFGSMLSTPILNPPQSAILGMHNIVKRPVVLHDEIVICPMMYLALSYDHRIIDGAQSVRFLVTIKEALEEPSRMLLNI